MDGSRKIRQPFAAAVRRHRRDAGLTQEELAERAGVAVPTIRNTESGRHTPQRHTFLALTGALGLSPEAFAGFEAAWRAQRGAGSGRDEAPAAPDERAPSPGGPPTTGREAPRQPSRPA